MEWVQRWFSDNPHPCPWEPSNHTHDQGVINDLSLPPRNDLFKRFSQSSRKNTVAAQSTSLTGEKEPGGCGWNEHVLSSSRGWEKGGSCPYFGLSLCLHDHV